MLGSTAVCAEEPKKESKIQSLVILKNDWVPGSKHTDIPCLSTYFTYKSLGGGFDLRYYSRGSVTEFQPFMTLKIKGPWYGFIGYSINESHAQYAQTGMWYVNNLGKLNVLLDVRNWWSLDADKARTFFDPYLQLLYPFPKRLNFDEKLYFGLEAELNHWWSGPAHNWYMIGPVVGCNLTKNMAVFVRPSHEWDVTTETKRAYRVRTGVILKF